MSDGLFLFNPLPWERDISGPVADHVVNPRGVPGDETAGRHFQDRDRERRDTSGFTDSEDRASFFDLDSYYLPSTTVPGYGWTTVSQEDLLALENRPFDERSTVETTRHRLTFDREHGGVTSWYDRQLNHEWVDLSADYPLGGFVHERVVDDDTDRPRKRLFDYGPEVDDRHAAIAGITDSPRGFQPDWHARRTGPERVTRHRVYDLPEGYEVHQRLATPQLETDVTLRVTIPERDDTLIFDARWDMGLRTHPEATYLAFPLALDSPTPRIDVGGQAMEPGADQLAGSAHDYYTVQHWADLSDRERGVTFGCPLNPMVQFGDFHFAENRQTFELERPLFLGWVTNNYWDTNFRAHQPGRVHARYHLSPHEAFDEAAAHRAGMEATHTEPLAQTRAERSVDDPFLTPDGQLLDLPEAPVLVTHVRPVDADTGIFHPGIETESDRDDDILVSLRNASDDATRVAITPGDIAVVAAARTDPTGMQALDELETQSGGVEFRLDGRETATVRLNVVPRE
jgi:hypothetical protein